MTRRFPHNPLNIHLLPQIRRSPHPLLFHTLFCAGKTSLEDFSVGEYAKLNDKKASWWFF